LSVVSGPIKLLSPDEMLRIHNGALEILENIGMWIDHQEALNYLAAYGCPVNFDTKVVKFPRYITENAVSKLREQSIAKKAKKIESAEGDSQSNLFPIKDITRDFGIRTGGFCPFILDLDGKRRLATLKDARDMIRLVDALEDVNFTTPPCSAQEIPAEVRPVQMAAEFVKHTSRPEGIEVWSKKDIDYTIRIALVVRGSEMELHERPILIGYAEARSPLCFDHNMAEIFMEYIKRGFPQALGTMPCGGTTAPASSAGTLALGFAETLAGLVLGFSIDEEAKVGISVNPSLSDMQTVSFPTASPDRLPLLVASGQMMREFYAGSGFFHHPGSSGFFHAGKTDACLSGVQAGFEKALSMAFPILAGVTKTIGTVGQVENVLTFSPVQLIIDTEIARYIKRMLQGFEVNEETIGIRVIEEVSPGGNFLAHEHTARNFRKEFWFSDLTERLPWAAWESQEFKGIEEKAREKVRKILAEHHPAPLDKEQIKEIDGIVEEAKRNISKNPTI